MNRLSYLWCSTLVSALVLSPWIQALAESADTQAGKQTPHLQGAKSRSTPTNAIQQMAPETIYAFGHGSTRQMTSLSRVQMERSVPGTSPLKVLNQLPGVMYQSADPFGAYEWSSSLYMRGFSQGQLGFTLDGVPLGDQQFNNSNGLSITRAISSDNIGRTDVSQGAGALDVASTNNLGGAVQFYSADPSHKRETTVEQTFGSNSTFRTFVRVNSGDLNKTGTRFYASYARTSLNLWKGSGYNYSDQVNFKIVQPLHGESSIKAFFDWSSLQQYDYQNMSLNYLKNIGPNLSNFYPDYGAAYAAAEGHYPASYGSASDPKDASYYAGTANRTDYLGGLTIDQYFGHQVEWKTTLYGHGNGGYSTWVSPYTPSPNGAPLSTRVQNPNILRGGFLSAVTYKTGRNTFNSGVWYEIGQFTESRAFAEAPLLGQGTLGNLTNGYPSNIFATAWNERFLTNTFQFHMQDSYRILHNLTVQAGFRSMLVVEKNDVLEQNPKYNAGNIAAQGSLTSSDAFLPQVSVNWRFLPRNELFFDVSHNMRAYPEDGYGTNASITPWSANQAQFNATAKGLRPETDWVYEGGYRYTSSFVSALLSLYRVNFSNRLQLISTGPIINPITAVQNVGGVTSNGVEGSVTLHPINGLTIFNSVSYNHSTYDQNVATSSGLERIKGKLIPNYPSFMYKGVIAYNYRNFGAHLDGNYISRRYLTYMNDEHVPGYFLANFGISYTFPKLSVFHDVKASFDIYNLFNKTYVATTGTVGNVFTGDDQNFLMGAPRQMFGSIRASF
ncbi:TonB-dependent receptor [Komagataeibacter swingsii]|uniref:TonB-dependent receptor n=1 Tax=Komagataeibacter swingsii TaxID=215220 RepID=A0A850P4C1_9PROT|nr:TonB-dependent receptor [Komagataeibacter swingsii]NVN38604.1 TonB-dependent receptor [Komagataeibacter swingsii]